MAATQSTSIGGWAAWLKIKRAAEGWTQTELGRRAGVSKDRVSKWEQGTEQPRVDMIRAVAAAFQVPAGAAMVESGLLRPEDIGAAVVEREDITALDKRSLLARAQAILEALAARIPDDTAAVEDPEPLRRRVVPVVRPEDLGAAGRDWAALRQQD